MFVVITPGHICRTARERGYLPHTVVGKFQSEDDARACGALHYFFVGRCELRTMPDEWAVEYSDGGPWKLYGTYGTGELASGMARYLRSHGNTVRTVPVTDSPAALASRREFNDGMTWELIGRHPATGRPTPDELAAAAPQPPADMDDTAAAY